MSNQQIQIKDMYLDKKNTQEQNIMRVLRYANYEDKDNYLTIEQLKLDLNIKKPEQLIKKLEAKNMIKVVEDKIYLRTEKSYCLDCWIFENPINHTKPENCRQIYDFEKEEHLRIFHNFKDDYFERYDINKMFSKNMPEPKRRHDWEIVDFNKERMQIKIICQRCRYEKTQYLGNDEDCHNLNFEKKEVKA